MRLPYYLAATAYKDDSTTDEPHKGCNICRRSFNESEVRKIWAVDAESGRAFEIC